MYTNNIRFKNIALRSLGHMGKVVAIACLLSTTACKKWLAVSPANLIKEDEQFSTQQGFVDALFGIYQKAASTSTGYGGDMTFSFVSVLAQEFENKTSQTTTFYGQATRYNYIAAAAGYQNVQGVISNAWSNSYASIAQANLILQNVDKHNDVFSGQAYNIVKGEALAMRAFLHFDLLRLFAPAYTTATATASAIPYMENFTVNPSAKLTLGAALDKCEADLKAAETLLAGYQDIDQIAANQGATSADLFLIYRQNHMNYWAVKGMLARLYLWKGDKTNALKYAKEVIDSKKFTFQSPTTLAVDASLATSDLTFSSEHLFSFYVSNLKVTADNLFKNVTPGAGESSDLFGTQAKLNALYENGLVGYGTDIRNPNASKSMWTIVAAGVVYSKKYYSDNTTNVKQRLVPVLRLPEMYYIAAEASPSIAEGLVYLNAVRTARLIPELTTTAVTTAAIFDAEILKEHQKEFYAEGQLWYYYKRKNTVTILNGLGNPMTPAKYILPFPQAEIEFGK